MKIQQINTLPDDEVARQRALAFENKCNHFTSCHELSNGGDSNSRGAFYWHINTE